MPLWRFSVPRSFPCPDSRLMTLRSSSLPMEQKRRKSVRAGSFNDIKKRKGREKEEEGEKKFVDTDLFS